MPMIFIHENTFKCRLQYGTLLLRLSVLRLSRLRYMTYLPVPGRCQWAPRKIWEAHCFNTWHWRLYSQ